MRATASQEPGRRGLNQGSTGIKGSALLAAAILLPSSLAVFGETSSAQPFAALPSASLSAIRGVDAAMNLSDDLPAQLLADDAVGATDRAAGDDTDADAAGAPHRTAAAEGAIDAETLCMAKVIHHEARNQSRAGQLAVAQLMMNRRDSGRFADTICGVANQPGQFFETASYRPDRSNPLWSTSVAVAREALRGLAPEAVPGALFYHAAYQAPTRFFRGLRRVASLGDHIFYR
jgi:N-acetylmuramoyl-L-alanine amidase